MSCSINDIANEMNLSRNTVSKALNGKPGVSAETRKEVIEKATEMKYRDFLANYEKKEVKGKGSIVFLTKSNAHSDFWLAVMKGIESELDGTGYKLALGVITDEEMEKIHLPSLVYSEDTKGIVLVELCDITICNAVTDLGIPVVTVDYPSISGRALEQMDIVTMENKSQVKKLIRLLAEKGMKRFAFAGNIFSSNVSNGFLKRHEAFIEEISELGLMNDEENSFLTESQQKFMNFSYLINRIKAIKTLPDAFICGNDWTALQLMQALQICGIKIGPEVAVAGFDNIKEGLECTPTLTTIDSDKELYGKTAARCLLDRIKDPTIPHLFLEYQTKLIIRESTGKITEK